MRSTNDSRVTSARVALKNATTFHHHGVKSNCSNSPGPKNLCKKQRALESLAMLEFHGPEGTGNYSESESRTPMEIVIC